MRCETCGTAPTPKNQVDVYNDFGDNPGVAVCDDCLHEEAWQACGAPVCLPARPEGYFHSPIGSFD